LSVSRFESPQEQAVHALYRELLRSWNRRDARGFAALFSESARYVDVDGHDTSGRFAIELEVARAFERTPSRPLIGIVREVRLLSEDVAVVSAAAGMYPPGSYRVDPSVNTLQTLLATREKAEHRRWRAMLYQSTPAVFRGRPDLAQQLTGDLDRALLRSAAATTRS
jgi:uncharacterized protein (TIGR02246 family)